MRYIDDHAQSLRVFYRFPAKVAQARLAYAVRRTGYCVVDKMRKAQHPQPGVEQSVR